MFLAKVTNAAVSLGQLCQVVDAASHNLNAQHSTVNAYDCCSNSDNLKTACVLRILAGTAVTTGTGGTCMATDTLCQ